MAKTSHFPRLPRRATDLRKGASAAVLRAEGTKSRTDAVGLEGLGQVPAVVDPRWSWGSLQQPHATPTKMEKRVFRIVSIIFSPEFPTFLFLGLTIDVVGLGISEVPLHLLVSTCFNHLRAHPKAKHARIEIGYGPCKLLIVVLQLQGMIFEIFINVIYIL